MRYQLWPFVRYEDDKYSIPDAMLAEIYRDLVESGRAGIVFYMGGIVTHKDFIDYLKDPKNHFVFVVDTETRKFVFMAWLNNIQGHTAYCHFSGLGDAPYRPETGRLVVDYWGSTGVPAVLVGVIPETNRAAIKLGMNLGFERAGTIPMLCGLNQEKTRVGGVILYYLFGGG